MLHTGLQIAIRMVSYHPVTKIIILVLLENNITALTQANSAGVRRKPDSAPIAVILKMEIAVTKPFLLWRDDWQLGCDCLDDQHIELASVLNQLHRYVVHDDESPYKERTEITRQLSRLVDVTRRHFKNEEALMRAHDYPRLEEHHYEHVMLLAELQELTREIESGGKPFTLDTLTALKHWQIYHVIYSDKLFANYMKHQSQSANDDDFGAISVMQS